MRLPCSENLPRRLNNFELCLYTLVNTVWIDLKKNPEAALYGLRVWFVADNTKIHQLAVNTAEATGSMVALHSLASKPSFLKATKLKVKMSILQSLARKLKNPAGNSFQGYAIDIARQVFVLSGLVVKFHRLLCLERKS